MIKWELLPAPRQTSMRLLVMRGILINLVCLVIGFLIGSQLTYTWHDSTVPFKVHNLPLQSSQDAINGSLSITAQRLIHKPATTFTSTSASASASISTSTSSPGIASRPNVDKQDVVEYLHRTTRVLCWIMTQPDNHQTKAIHIRNTWGRRCNKLLFISTEEDDELPAIKLDVEEGRANLWNKTKSALKYIYDHHFDDADWFLKADDDTYVIMENLRYFLYAYPPEAAVYFGCKFRCYVKQGYMSGGAGYVLSKTALHKFATEAYYNTKKCGQTYQAEDAQLGECLQNVGVVAGDSRDEERKERFIPLSPELIIPEDKTWWYKKYAFVRPNENATCCSPSAISFHYINPDHLYVMDYLLYTLRPYGVYHNTKLPRKLSTAEVYTDALEYFYPLPFPPVSHEGANVPIENEEMDVDDQYTTMEYENVTKNNGITEADKRNENLDS